MKEPVVWVMGTPDAANLTERQTSLETLKNLGVRAIAVDDLNLDVPPEAIKLVSTVSLSNEVIKFLTHFTGPIVLELHPNIDNGLLLFPLAELIIFSVRMAEKIINCPITSYPDMQKAAQHVLALGAKRVLIQDEFFENTLFNHAYWTDGQESFWLASPRLKSCVNKDGIFSSALAGARALGYSCKDALVIAKMYECRGIRQAVSLDSEEFVHNPWPNKQDDLPYLSLQPLKELPMAFKRCQLGLYPVVDDSLWLEKLLPLGVKCIQLRIKNASLTHLEKEIKQSVALAKRYNATLFVNDYWELALRYGANGVHLGQEDLDTADIEQIKRAGLLLGVSTHCYYEVARAHVLNPSYIACGPIYPTTSKVMAFQPQGIEQLHYWRQLLNYPLVAIGGVNLERLPDVLATGVEGVSLISAITKAKNPLAITSEFLAQINRSIHV